MDLARPAAHVAVRVHAAFSDDMLRLHRTYVVRMRRYRYVAGGPFLVLLAVLLFQLNLTGDFSFLPVLASALTGLLIGLLFLVFSFRRGPRVQLPEALWCSKLGYLVLPSEPAQSLPCAAAWAARHKRYGRDPLGWLEVTGTGVSFLGQSGDKAPFEIRWAEIASIEVVPRQRLHCGGILVTLQSSEKCLVQADAGDSFLGSLTDLGATILRE